MRKLTAIYIYPVKSLGGISLTECLTEERGLQYDRRWMLVDENGVFITQRQFPKMALFQPTLFVEGIEVASNDGESRMIPFLPLTNDMIEVKVWDSTTKGVVVSPELNEWFSDKIGVNCRLVYMGDYERKASPERVRKNENVSYADGYPYLIVGEESMNDLNNRLDESVPVNRFRPNLVFSGGNAFDEDRWNNFTIGNTRFYGVKPCARCVMTTIDHTTGEKTNGEPLKTLNAYRKEGSRVNFGLNACAIDEGVIRVGDEILVHSEK